MKWVMFLTLILWVFVSPIILIYWAPPEFLEGNGSQAIAYASQRFALGIVIIFMSSLILGYRVVWMSILFTIIAIVLMNRSSRKITK